MTMNTKGMNMMICERRSISLPLFLILILPGCGSLLNVPEDHLVLNSSGDVEALFPGGIGTESDPYQISNVLELQNIKEDINAHYILVNEINASITRTWDGGKGFEIIAPDEVPGNGIGGSNFFYGSLEGNGYSIHDLYINRSDEECTGLIGMAMGGHVSNLSLIDCHIIGESIVGGIVGAIFPGDFAIRNCNVNGAISGDEYIGGLVGFCYWGKLIGCSSNSSISGTGRIGGVIGAGINCQAHDCIGGGSITGEYMVGGLIGDFEDCIIRNSYYDLDRTTLNSDYVLTPYGIYHDQFEDWIDNDLLLNIEDYLENEEGTRNYLVSSIYDFKSMLAFSMYPQYSFKQTSDIDFVDEPDLYLPVFTASCYDGDSHRIINARINISIVSSLGFFGMIGEPDSTTNIKDISFCNISITGKGTVGTIGYLNIDSTVKNVSSSGNFKGDVCGGIVGYGWGASGVQECCAFGSVEGNQFVGGIIGIDYFGNVTNCNYIGEVEGNEFVGGLIGMAQCDSFTNCFASSVIRGSNYVGYIVGGSYSSSFSSCFWESGKIGNITGSGNPGDDPSGLYGKTKDQMKKEKTFIGWDFSEVWVIAEGHSYPFLKYIHEGPEMDISEVDLIATECSLYSSRVNYLISENLPGTVNEVIFTLRSNRDFLSITNEGIISGIPNNEDVGSCWVNISLTDLCGVSDQVNLTIEVNNINDEPAINATILPFAVEDEDYTFSLHGIDVDPTNDVLTWSIDETDSDFLNLDPSTGCLFGIPGNDDVGEWWILVNVSDGNGGFDEVNLSLEVLNVNDDPKILEFDMPLVFEDSSFFIDIDAEDLDPTNDNLEWYLMTELSFLHLDPHTGNLAGTPSNDDVGDWWVNVSVSDGKSGLDWRNFTLKVINVNDGPELNITKLTLSFDEDSNGASFVLDDVFVDIDGDDLSYDYDESDNLTISIEGGSAIVISNPDWCGMEIIQFSASDEFESVSINVTIDVNPTNDAPTDVQIIAEIAYKYGTVQLANSSATDRDIPYGDELTFSWSSNISGEIGQGRSINLSLPVGCHLIILTVTDRHGLSEMTTMEIEIKPVKEYVDDNGNVEDDLPIVWIVIITSIVLVLVVVIIIFFLIRNRRTDGEPVGRKNQLIPGKEDPY